MTKAHGAYDADYNKLTGDLLAARPDRSAALLEAVGGGDNMGDVQLAILDHYGLRGTSYLIDIGCGSGRLTRRAARMPDLRYLGTDVVRDLLVEAARTSNRSDFTFVRVRSLSIPEKANAADMVCFFSVGTHLLHEEFYVYLEEAKRVLKPDGVIVFSFLDVETPQGRSVLQSNVRHVKRGARPPHLDVFIGRSEIEPWADMLGLALVEIVPGDVPWTAPDHLTPYLSGPVVNAIHGQSTAVLRKLA